MINKNTDEGQTNKATLLLGAVTHSCKCLCYLQKHQFSFALCIVFPWKCTVWRLQQNSPLVPPWWRKYICVSFSVWGFSITFLFFVVVVVGKLIDAVYIPLPSLVFFTLGPAITAPSLLSGVELQSPGEQMLKWRHVIAVPCLWLIEARVAQPVTGLSLFLPGPCRMSHRLILVNTQQQQKNKLFFFKLSKPLLYQAELLTFCFHKSQTVSDRRICLNCTWLFINLQIRKENIPETGTKYMEALCALADVWSHWSLLRPLWWIMPVKYSNVASVCQ